MSDYDDGDDGSGDAADGEAVGGVGSGRGGAALRGDIQQESGAEGEEEPGDRRWRWKAGKRVQLQCDIHK